MGQRAALSPSSSAASGDGITVVCHVRSVFAALTCAASGVAVLALESGRTLLLEQEVCAQIAKKNKISLTTI